MTVAIEPNRVAEFAPEQLVDRDADDLAGQVPERDLDSGHRRDGRTRHCAVEQPGPAHLLVEHVYIQRILANDVLGERFDHRRAALAAMDAFAVPDHTLVGVDADIGGIAVSLDFSRADISDFHNQPPARDDWTRWWKSRPVSCSYSSILAREVG